jgi:DNA repair exonuclease SbcCD nuclease subunit
MKDKIRFIHAADLHLGKTLYGIPQRYDDFFKAFEWLLNKAIYEKVDFVLICGDFIDSEQKINPSTLSKIITTIQDFQSKSKDELGFKIPIICIEGNHETPFFSDRTWLELIADLNLIILLSGEYNRKSKRIIFTDYSYRERKGGKITIKDSVIYGMSYFGSSTPGLFSLIKEEIPKNDKFIILLMHFGIQGHDKRKKGYEINKELKRLHKHVDYLALGHFHNQYQLPVNDPWIFNPGSLEINEITEYNEKRGIFLVDIFPAEKNNFQVKSLTSENGNTNDVFNIPNRKFLSFAPIDISESKSFEEAQNMVITKLRKLGVPERNNMNLPLTNLDVPILYITIKGMVPYSELEVDLAELRRLIFDTFSILGLKLNNHVFSKTGYNLEVDESWSYERIEEEALLATIEEEENFKAHKSEISNLLLNQLKNKLTKNADYTIIKKELDNWFDLNPKILEKVKEILRLEKKPNTVKQLKKEEKKKQKAKQVSIDKIWDEEDFAEEFGDFKEILNIENDDVEIDDIIDDGELDF